MIQKMSDAFPRTRHDSRKDISSAHGLLEQAGFIRAVGAGVYTLLPMGWRVHKNITDLIYDRMSAIGANNIQMPLLHPVDLWERTGRLEAGMVSKALFTTADPRAGKQYVLSPTAEEIATSLVAAEVKSWRDLPLYLHQIATKFRAEIRPHSGLLRCREFVMSDCYSFDPTEDQMHESVSRFSDLYRGIFKEVCVAPIISVSASNGEIGGKGSTELMLSCEIGEDVLLICENCGFSANIEVLAGEDDGKCPSCQNSTLERKKGMELGHVFSLQSTYSDKMGAFYTDSSGSRQSIWMGCYGLGTTRLLQAIAEVNRGENGLRWPASIAPYNAHLVVIKPSDPDHALLASQLLGMVENTDTSLLVDDREVNPGAKFKDADLIGCPWRVTIGREAKNGKVEVWNRHNNTGDVFGVHAALQLIAS